MRRLFGFGGAMLVLIELLVLMGSRSTSHPTFLDVVIMILLVVHLTASMFMYLGMSMRECFARITVLTVLLGTALFVAAFFGGKYEQMMPFAFTMFLSRGFLRAAIVFSVSVGILNFFLPEGHYGRVPFASA